MLKLCLALVTFLAALVNAGTFSSANVKSLGASNFKKELLGTEVRSVLRPGEAYRLMRIVSESDNCVLLRAMVYVRVLSEVAKY